MTEQPILTSKLEINRLHKRNSIFEKKTEIGKNLTAIKNIIIMGTLPSGGEMRGRHPSY